MTLLVASLAVFAVGALVALAMAGRPRAATWSGLLGAICGCILGLSGALLILSGRTGADLEARWQVPYASFHIGLDPLSALFLVAICALGMLSSVYGSVYMLKHGGSRNLGIPWFFFNILLASMLLVVTARNGILFLTAWEMMTVSSFFLVTYEHEKGEARSAGWTYLIMAHAGTAFLLAFFAILGSKANSLEFEAMGAVSGLSSVTLSALFIFAIVGFGTKAGLVPFHIWLPEAHPAAPSHVSALMSGVMIKMGIYGILRALIFLGPPPEWWGILLITLGLVSGVLGVLFALSQHDIKRLLAYHSVENIGIILIGIGLGTWGLSRGLTSVAVLGFAGGLLHVLNHATFKGLLFLGAGSVVHATGERNMERLGGLMKVLPFTGVSFVIASAAISGLPPLNGFVSEFLIFFGALRGMSEAALQPTLLAAVLVGLGLIGGLATACFAKVCGIVFLGTPRQEEQFKGHSEHPGMVAPMLVLAAVCVFIGVLPVFALRLVWPASSMMTGVPQANLLASDLSSILMRITLLAALTVGLAVALALLRKSLLARRRVVIAPTWGCGYEAPSPRMQYTASSFAQPLLRVFRYVTPPRQHLHRPEGYFSTEASFRSETPDPLLAKLYRPFLSGIERVSSSLHRLQHGRIHIYLLYIFSTLVALLAWWRLSS